MNTKRGAVVLALLLLCSFSVQAQKTQAQKKLLPAPIQFQGAPQYTQQELLAAAGLKPDARLNPREVKAHAKLLNDTGLFKEVKFVSGAKTVTFTLTPSSQLFPLHLENLPLTPGKELDERLHQRFPLYHSQLPATGSMQEGIRQTLEEMLAAKGIKASVKAALTSGLGPKKITAMNYFIASPEVKIGRIQFAGISSAMQAKVNLAASGQTGNGFDSEYTSIGLKRVFEDLYQDLGYAAVEVTVAQLDAAVLPDLSIEVPYTVTVKEGSIYKLGTIDLPADALVKRADVDKALAKYQAGAGRPYDLFVQAVHDAYHNLGYLDCAVTSHMALNEATHIVNYSLAVDPGSPYRLASVKFDGAPDALAAKLKLAWKMAPGDIFDESYASNFATLAQKKDKQLSKWMQTVVTSYDVKSDPDKHQVNCIFHFAKAVNLAK